MLRQGAGWIRFVLIPLTVVCLVPANAHQVSAVSAAAKFDTQNRHYLIDVSMEVVPSEDDATNEIITPEEAARSFAEDYLTVLFDDVDQTPELSISRDTLSDDETPEELIREQVSVKLSGDIPEGASTFLLYLEPMAPMAVMMVTVKDQRPSRRMQVILAGEFSRPVDVGTLAEGDPFEIEPASDPAGAESGSERSSSTGHFGGAFTAVWRAFFGFSLLPLCLAVCLFLPTMERRSITKQLAILFVTSAVGLLLAWTEAIRIPHWTQLVLGGIVFVLALEGLLIRSCRWWRCLLVGIGGLLVGFQVVLPTESVMTPILGVLGLSLLWLVTAAIVAVLLLLLSRFDWYRSAVIQPLAVLLCGYGMFCLIEPLL